MVYLDLIFNLALLVALTIMSGFIDWRWPQRTRRVVSLQGALFGAVAVLGMLRPLDMGSGLIFDGRSVMLSLCALFFGPWAACIATVMVVSCRAGMGGSGAIMGVSVSISSSLLGLLTRYWLRPDEYAPRARQLYVFGLAVHVVMVALMTTLPRDVMLSTLLRIGPPVLLLYPLATVLAGKILSDQVAARRTMAALKESNERIRRLSDNLSGGMVYQIDSGEDGRQRVFTYLSAGVVKMHGIGADEALRNADAIYGQILMEDLDSLLHRETTAVETMSVFMAEARVRMPSGDIRWRLFTSAPRRLPNNHLVWDGIELDITERKKAEAEREKMREQLQQYQKMESVGRLAGGVAHDFNNMLQTILGNVEMALSRTKPENPLFGELMEIRHAAEHSANLTRQLLAFARKQAVTPKTLDLNATVEGMLKMLRRLIGEDIELVWRPAPNVYPVFMDPSQIDQILANLCVNARDAISGVGQVVIETGNVEVDEALCREHPGAAPGRYALLKIRDTGSGMARETMSRLFEPFFTTKKPGEGTGLGLAMIYGIVKQNNGFIQVESEQGKGASFAIYLPRHEGPLEAGERSPETSREPARGRATVLLVEDEATILNLEKNFLEKQGYTVLTSTSPAEALSLVEQSTGEIDLLITDVVMPGMNGRELAECLRAKRPLMKCLFTSGYTSNVILPRGVRDEGTDFIQKPFSMKDLADKIKAVLDA